jgi:hypothetical protein
MGIRGQCGRRWPRLAALPLLAVIAAAGCASAGQTPGNQPTAANAATNAAGPTQAGTASPAQPLAAVGAGWTLAEYSSSTSFDATPRKDLATTLYLVNPQGGRDALYRWPAGQAEWRLLDWSGDKARALFAGPTTNTVGQLVLATGKFTSFKLPGGTQPVSYSRPDGTAILAAQQAGSTDKILRYDLNGRLEQTLASGPQNSASVAVYSPSGTTLAVNGAKALELVTNNGVVARSLPVPGNPTCQPARWWNASTILASCLAPDSAAPRLWLVPVSGARPTALTAQRNGKGPDLGDIGAWQLPGGVYLQALAGCGVIFIAKQASNGLASAVNVPQTTGNDNQIVTAVGSRLLVRAQTSCEESTSLLWFTPATNAVQMLISAPPGTQGVTAAVPYTRGS